MRTFYDVHEAVFEMDESTQQTCHFCDHSMWQIVRQKLACPAT